MTSKPPAQMKEDLTIEAAHAPGDGLLESLAEALRVAAITPECLVWSNLEGTGEVRVWMTLTNPESKCQQLARRFSAIPSVRRVLLHGPGGSIVAALYAAPSPSSPGT